MAVGAGQSSSGHEVSYIIAACLICAGIYFFWRAYGPYIYSFLLMFASYEAVPLTYFNAGMVDFKSYVESLDPNEVEFLQMVRIMDHVGRWYSPLAILLLLCIGWRGWTVSVREIFNRRRNRKMLLELDVKKYPCIAPILNWGRSLLEEDMDSGPWMTARHPIQFVAKYGLLEDKKTHEIIPRDLLIGKDGLANKNSGILSGEITAVFRREAAVEVMQRQFGKEFMGLNRLEPYLYGLAGAFMLFGTGKDDNKKEAQHILDSMSLSFRPPCSARSAHVDLHWPFLHKAKSGRKNYFINPEIPDKTRKKIAALWKSEEIQYVVRPHNRYLNNVLLALYAFAREKGVLDTAEFIWLRPVNRKLFYLLNNYGRRVAFPEIAGARCHYEAESALAIKNGAGFEGNSIPGNMKQVDKAVNALELAMYEEGWISIDNIHDELDRENRYELPKKQEKNR